eukprot:g14606.t1
MATFTKPACDILCTALEPILLERAHHEKAVGGDKKQGDLEIPLRGRESVKGGEGPEGSKGCLGDIV